MKFRVSVLLSLQRALWDLVGPNLRGVTATFDYPVVTARFLFENDPTEDDLEDVSLAETHVIADFLEDVTVDFTPVCAPVSGSRELLPGEHWVFLRKEP